jgi:hypothetical protein
VIWLAGAAHAALVAADHHGFADAAGLSWASTLVVDSADDLVLATPIAAGDLVDLRGATAVYDGDRVVRLVPHALGIVVRIRQDADEPLRPPLVLDATAVQELGLDGMTFEPDPSLGLQKRIGRWASPSIGRAERSAAHERLVAQERIQGLAETPHRDVLICADRMFPDGLAGEIRPPGAVPAAVVFGAVVLTGGLFVVGIVGYRVLDRFTRRERIQAWFDDETAVGG